MIDNHIKEINTFRRILYAGLIEKRNVVEELGMAREEGR